MAQSATGTLKLVLGNTDVDNQREEMGQERGCGELATFVMSHLVLIM